MNIALDQLRVASEPEWVRMRPAGGRVGRGPGVARSNTVRLLGLTEQQSECELYNYTEQPAEPPFRFPGSEFLLNRLAEYLCRFGVRIFHAPIFERKQNDVADPKKKCSYEYANNYIHSFDLDNMRVCFEAYIHTLLNWGVARSKKNLIPENQTNSNSNITLTPRQMFPFRPHATKTRNRVTIVARIVRFSATIHRTCAVSCQITHNLFNPYETRSGCPIRCPYVNLGGSRWLQTGSLSARSLCWQESSFFILNQRHLTPLMCRAAIKACANPAPRTLYAAANTLTHAVRF